MEPPEAAGIEQAPSDVLRERIEAEATRLEEEGLERTAAARKVRALGKSE